MAGRVPVVVVVVLAVAGFAVRAAAFDRISYGTGGENAWTDSSHLFSDGSIVGNGFLLGSSSPRTSGVVWHPTKVQGLEDGFELRFNFTHTFDLDPGSGLAFVIQTQSATYEYEPPGAGAAEDVAGFGVYPPDGLPNVWMIEFDAFNDAGVDSLAGDHIAVSRMLKSPLGQVLVAGIDNANVEHTVLVRYSGSAMHKSQTANVTIYYDDMTIPVLVVAMDLADLLTLDVAGGAWVGFGSCSGQTVGRRAALHSFTIKPFAGFTPVDDGPSIWTIILIVGGIVVLSLVVLGGCFVFVRVNSMQADMNRSKGSVRQAAGAQGGSGRSARDKAEFPGTLSPAITHALGIQEGGHNAERLRALKDVPGGATAVTGLIDMNEDDDDLGPTDPMLAAMAADPKVRDAMRAERRKERGSRGSRGSSGSRGRGGSKGSRRNKHGRVSPIKDRGSQGARDGTKRSAAPGKASLGLREGAKRAPGKASLSRGSRSKRGDVPVVANGKRSVPRNAGSKGDGSRSPTRGQSSPDRAAGKGRPEPSASPDRAASTRKKSKTKRERKESKQERRERHKAKADAKREKARQEKKKQLAKLALLNAEAEEREESTRVLTARKQGKFRAGEFDEVALSGATLSPPGEDDTEGKLPILTGATLPPPSSDFQSDDEAEDEAEGGGGSGTTDAVSDDSGSVQLKEYDSGIYES